MPSQTGPADSSPPPSTPPRHRAARLEDRIHRLRERRARARGQTPMIIPYTGYGTVEWVRVLCRVLLAKPGRRKTENVRGWRSFTSVPVDDATVTIEIDGVAHPVRTLRGGVVDTVLPARLAPGWHAVLMSTGGSEPVSAPVFIAAPDASFGIVSDVDDTVMVTALPRPLLAAWNTFVLNEHARAPVPGMAVLFERLATAHPGCPVVYLSTGAWNTAPALSRFLSRNLYPPGPLLLTDWGPTHDRWFRSGRAHKRETLDRLAEEFPGIRWLLIGDDGQHDEELYGEFAARHPQSVAAIAIRQLSTGEAVLAGRRARPESHGGEGSPRWIHAENGAGLAERLREAGIL